MPEPDDDGLTAEQREAAELLDQLDQAAMAKAVRRGLRLSSVLYVLEAGLSLIAGWAAKFPPLVGDAEQNFSNNVLGTWIAMWVKRRIDLPADHKHTGGHGASNLLGGVVNGALLSLAGLLLVSEGVSGFSNPEPVNLGIGFLGAGLSLLNGIVVALGFAGGLVRPLKRLARVPLIRRIFGAESLEQADLSSNPTLFSVLQDNLVDIMSSVVMLAGLGLTAMGLPWATPVLSIGMGAKMVDLARPVMKKAMRAFLRSPPQGLDPRDLIRRLEQHPKVMELGNLHVDSIDGEAAVVHGSVVPTPGLTEDEFKRLSDELREWAGKIHPRFATWTIAPGNGPFDHLYAGGGGRRKPEDRGKLTERQALTLGRAHTRWLRSREGQTGSRRAAGGRHLNVRDRNLDRVDLHALDLNGINALGAKLNKASLHGARLRQCHFSFVTARDADLRQVDAEKFNLQRADLKGTLIAGAAIRHSRLIRTDLSGVVASGQRVTLKDVDARGSVWTDAVLVNVMTSEVDLRGARFDGARIVGGSPFAGARLEGATFRDARVDARHRTDMTRAGADLRNVIWLSPAESAAERVAASAMGSAR
jgi:cation diffusion facilitator family transporter